MKSSRRSAWILTVGLAISGCKGDVDGQPAADPLDDPWVNAIDTGDDEVVVEALPDGHAPASAVVEADSLPEAQPAAVIATPSAPHAAAGKSSKAAAAESEQAPEQAPEQPTGEQAAEAEVPVVEPAATPSVEPAKPASPPPITSADFHGNYRYAGGKAQRDEVTAAIEGTVKQLSKAIHGIARKRLTEANPVDDSVEISVVGDKITTTFASGFDVTCVIDGPTVQTTGIGGEKLAVRVRSKDGKLVQILQGKEGARTIVYVLSADRNKLTVHHKITADRLPAPLTYRLTYSRK